MKCALLSAGCEDGNVKCEESLLLALQCKVVTRRSCSWTARVQHTRTHSAHARAWLAHGAYKFYRCERSYSISLRQLPPRLVRVLLVYNILKPHQKPCQCQTISASRLAKTWELCSGIAPAPFPQPHGRGRRGCQSKQRWRGWTPKLGGSSCNDGKLLNTRIIQNCAFQEWRKQEFRQHI